MNSLKFNHLETIEKSYKIYSRMTYSVRAIALLSVFSSRVGADDFNYRFTTGDDYGPKDWDKVKCRDLDSCVSSNRSNRKTLHIELRKV